MVRQQLFIQLLVTLVNALSYQTYIYYCLLLFRTLIQAELQHFLPNPSTSFPFRNCVPYWTEMGLIPCLKNLSYTLWNLWTKIFYLRKIFAYIFHLNLIPLHFSPQKLKKISQAVNIPTEVLMFTIKISWVARTHRASHKSTRQICCPLKVTAFSIPLPINLALFRSPHWKQHIYSLTLTLESSCSATWSETQRGPEI